MRLSRRGTLVGLGAVALGTGSLLSTGAATRPAAERPAVGRVEDDATGSVRLLIEGDDGEGTRWSAAGLENQAYVRRNGNGLLTFEFGGVSDGTERAGLNENAVARFDRLFAIHNGASRAVTVDYETPVGVSLYRGETPDDDLSDAGPIPAGHQQNVGVEIDTRGGHSLNGAEVIGIEAAAKRTETEQ